MHYTTQCIASGIYEKQFNVRLETVTIKKVKEIAEIEKNKTGYLETASSLASQILSDYSNGYKK
jgi:hypothetical protein